ncbi:hypothetical protein E1218_10185 [Kribbella turkmenica]|uniref:Uncharacterized protein n=1 Tax=Kribbella turkmenica TaxID=2530375 RepID=A0A4R4XAG6_9ACTN|nr:hypothetical protein [Kribbella turkmenica]TDD27493.1 hypothetical protein E1218_10185 [Kribbella turkmenica]
MSTTVVLLSTRRLPPAFFDTVREDLGDPEVTLAVISWVAAPADLDAGKVSTFTIIGPRGAGEPEAVAPRPEPTGTTPPAATVAGRNRGARKVAEGMLPKAIKTGLKFLRSHRADKELGKAFWDRVLSHRDALSTIGTADVVIALDAGAIWAGWNLGRRKASTPVVLGIPAARRELDMLKVPAGHG